MPSKPLATDTPQEIERLQITLMEFTGRLWVDPIAVALCVVQVFERLGVEHTISGSIPTTILTPTECLI